jgi:hypothetical protein
MKSVYAFSYEFEGIARELVTKIGLSLFDIPFC